MRLTHYLFQFLLFLLFCFLQSILFVRNLPIYRFLPDIAFIIFLFCSINNRQLVGAISGFIAGIIIHIFMLPDSTLGVYSFVYVFIGYFAGMLKGKLIVDNLFLPLLYFTIAFIIEKILLFFFSLLPEISIASSSIISILIEYGVSLLFVPLVYNLLRLFKLINLNQRKSQ